ncbi:MAG: hypothetical protein ACR2M6_02340, partial [Vampirovibrionia bacterium]
MKFTASLMNRTASLVGLLLFTAATTGSGYAQAQQQDNQNSAVAMPTNSQQNQSRSESIGGGIYNYQINP